MIDFFGFFIRFLPDLMRGAAITLLLTAEGLAAGFVLGLLAAYGRVYGNKFWRGLAVGYIELFRGTPLLMQLFIIYYGLPGLGITLSRELSAFLALGLNSGAYQAEYLRGSILAIGDGQLMAGRAIGMSRFKAIWYIILPQALRLAGVAFQDIQLLEMNEAFAAQVLANEMVFREAKLSQKWLGREEPIGEINREILNVNGGAVALGHPVGSSGTRLVLTLLKEMQRRDLHLGLATLCVGGGQGGAMVVERR